MCFKHKIIFKCVAQVESLYLKNISLCNVISFVQLARVHSRVKRGIIYQKCVYLIHVRSLHR